MKSGFRAFFLLCGDETDEALDESNMDEETKSYIKDTPRKHDISPSIHTSLQDRSLDYDNQN
jgi:hypothetical protein